MCGLVGGVGALHQQDKNIFTHLLCTNVFRGAHGTGLFKTYKEALGNQEYFEYTKSILPSSAFIWESEYESFLWDQLGVSSLMGHSRHATIGEVNEDNCHPFVVSTGKGKKKEDKLVGFHNGTIRGKFEGSSDYDTDSEALYNLIYKKGLHEALTQVHAEAYDVAYALQYYDNTTGEIYLIRNSKRPLYLAKVEHMEEYWWASEKGMLQWSLGRIGAKVNWIKSVPEGALITIRPFARFNEKRIDIEEDFFKEPVRTYVAPPATNVTYYPPKKVEEGKVISLGQGNHWNNYVKDRKFVRIGQLSIPFQEYRDILKSGCCVCSSPNDMSPTEKDFEQVFLMGSPHDYVCKGCQSSQTWETFNISTDMLTFPKWEYEVAVG